MIYPEKIKALPVIVKTSGVHRHDLIRRDSVLAIADEAEEYIVDLESRVAAYQAAITALIGERDAFHLAAGDAQVERDAAREERDALIESVRTAIKILNEGYSIGPFAELELAIEPYIRSHP